MLALIAVVASVWLAVLAITVALCYAEGRRTRREELVDGAPAVRTVERDADRSQSGTSSSD